MIDASKPPVQFYADQNRMQNLKLTDKNPESIKAASKEFASLFMEMTIKAMRDADKSLKSESSTSNELDTYNEMYDKQLALHIASSGNFSLADEIAKQLSPKGLIKKE